MQMQPHKYSSRRVVACVALVLLICLAHAGLPTRPEIVTLASEPGYLYRVVVYSVAG